MPLKVNFVTRCARSLPAFTIDTVEEVEAELRQ